MKQHVFDKEHQAEARCVMESTVRRLQYVIYLRSGVLRTVECTSLKPGAPGSVVEVVFKILYSSLIGISLAFRQHLADALDV